MVQGVMLVQRTLMRKRNWQAFMHQHEMLVLSGLTVKHEKGGGVFSSGRKRVQLILTSKRRFVIVNPAKMEMKGEIWMDGEGARVTMGGEGGQEGKSFTIHGATTRSDDGGQKSPGKRRSSAGKSPTKRGSISADGTESIMFTDLLGNAQRCACILIILSASYSSYSVHHTHHTQCIILIILSASYSSYSVHAYSSYSVHHTHLTQCIILILLKSVPQSTHSPPPHH
jgi:hypothetical protein